MLKIFYSLALCVCMQTAYADNQFAIHKLQKNVAEGVLKQFKNSQSQLLLLAEAGHEQEEYTRFFADIWDDTFRFVALEVRADQQPLIDAFMRGDSDEMAFAERAALREFLISLREHNRKGEVLGSWPPVEVLAIDKPVEKGMAPTTWFQGRDAFMFAKLQPYIQKGQKGLVYMGGGHLTKHPLPTPRILRKSYKMPAFMDTLGAKLEREIPGRIFRVWMSAEADPIVDFSMLPPDMGFLSRIDPLLRKSMRLTRDKVFAIATFDPQFREAEADSRSGSSIAFYLYKDFNYYVSLARPETRGISVCGALLSKEGRKQFLHGLMMRLL